MQKLYAFGLILLFAIPFVCCEGDEAERDPKLISTFQIVRFPNDPCVGSNSRNGTCYTSQECSDKSGTSAGSCADGFGVCCTFIIDTCGSSTSENLTAWKNPTTITSGSCSLTVYPIDDTICSIRLDLTTFVITGPSTITNNQFRRKFGQPTMDILDTDNDLQGSTNNGACLTDTFYVKSASPSTGPPVICGTATGEHMYIEADPDNGNYLDFYLHDAAATSAVAYPRGVTTLASRSWDMTITQIECTSKTLPPVGCTKYFYNAAGTATLKSSNWQVTTTTSHLSMQHDRYCIRRERGMCVGCFAAADSNFAVSGRDSAALVDANYGAPYGCCGYSTMGSVEDITIAANNVNDGNGHDTAIAADLWAKGLTQWGWDCVVIPGAYVQTIDTYIVISGTATTANLQQVLAESPTADVHPLPSSPQICGQGKGLGAGVGDLDEGHAYNQANARVMSLGYTNNVTVCTRQTPFMMEFLSDDIEGQGGGNNAGLSETNSASNVASLGFNIAFKQLAC